MTLQAIAPVAIRLNGEVVHYKPGAVFTVTDIQAQRILERAPGKVRLVTLPPDTSTLNGPIPPLQPGWLVAYRTAQGRLAGGCDDREQGTVHECEWSGKFWSVVLTNGQRLPLGAVLSVGKTDGEGQVMAAWTVREHGYDGEGSR